MWSLSISSVKLFGIPIGLKRLPDMLPKPRRLRTMQLLIVPWSNAITPAFRVRERVRFFDFQTQQMISMPERSKRIPVLQLGLAVSEDFLTAAQPTEHSPKSLLKSDHARFCLTGASYPAQTCSLFWAMSDVGFSQPNMPPAVEFGLFTTRSATAYILRVCWRSVATNEQRRSKQPGGDQARTGAAAWIRDPMRSDV